MFLERPGEVMPKAMRIHSVVEKVPPGKWGGEKPTHLTTLELSGWPEDVKRTIVRIYAAKRLPDPARQKLVEPVARVFGGRRTETGIDLSKVNWGMVVDYFEWEAESIMHTERAKTLQKQAMKKYGGIFSHYQVYETP